MSDDSRSAERRFVAGVVHEINNALTAIVGLAEKLESEARLDDDVRSQVGAIAAQARRLHGLSERLAAFSRGEAACDAPPRSEGAAPRAGRRSAAGSLLVVDDEEAIRQIVTWQLQGMGHDVIAVDSAESALAACDTRPQRFDLALIDVVLPGRSGLELARELRRRHLPVILLSGSAAGVQDDVAAPCLTKPVPLDELRRAVAEALAASDADKASS